MAKYPQTSKHMIEAINLGKTWYDNKLNYPLYNRRRIYGGVSKEKAKKIIEDLKSEKSLIQIAKELIINQKVDIIKNLKIIENFNEGLVEYIRDLYDGDFPISLVNNKKVRTIPLAKLKKIEYDLLNSHISYEKLAQKYNVSDSTIYRINKGEIKEYINLNLIYPLRIQGKINPENINYVNKEFEASMNLEEKK